MKIDLRSRKWTDWRFIALYVLLFLVTLVPTWASENQTKEQLDDFSDEFVQKRDVYKFDKKQLDKYK